MKIANIRGLSFAVGILGVIASWVFTQGAFAAADVESRSSRGSSLRIIEGEVPQAAAVPSMELLKKMEFLQQEVQELRGKFEEQSYQLKQLQDHQKKLYLDLDRRLREGGGTVRAVGANSQAEVDARLSTQVAAQTTIAPTAAALTTASAESPNEERSYQMAYQFIQNKDYDSALSGFKTLVAQFPQGKYAPNAYYWLGEIYLVKGNSQLAWQSFDTAQKQFPTHPKAADCLLKLGYVAYTKGQWDQSKTYLNQVKTQFPGTTSAQLADSRLDLMKQEGRI